ncbi:MAG: multifunctional CCA tRNA nucleotidyl transferase/2'3'-cyclic phosphodiesterase/2'nucleotidase/phosphatase [Gammaproteobacteria bacterium]|nr:multifunctional CCA tRNA nucleotidyl transferase/2'3'-cyclic phosphodiesterase/2'nucleotidase/phosphatase [Gammaproteobacteria bacterium]
MQTYLVGGAIRDRLLGLPAPYEKDWVVVNGTPDQLKSKGYKKVGKSFPVFIDPETGEEYALARRERKTSSGYHGFEFDAGPEISLEEDLSRRDLTINAIAEDEDGNLIDPYGGRDDLNNRVLRHVSEAFREDPLRVLRIARFKAKLSQFDFIIADETINLVQNLVGSGELSSLVPERTWLETEKVFKADNFNEYFITLINLNAFNQIYPDLKDLDSEFFSSHLILESAKQDYSPEIRFASIFYSLLKRGEKDIKNRIEAMQENMRFANSYKRLPIMLNNSLALIEEDTSKFTADHQLRIIESIDAIRNPENLDQISQLIMLDHSSDFTQKLAVLQKSLDHAKNIKINNLDESKLAGNEIAKHIRELRLKAIESNQ